MGINFDISSLLPYFSAAYDSVTQQNVAIKKLSRPFQERKILLKTILE